MSTTIDLGIATAYGYAVSKGYTGTEDEFAELMLSYATVAEQAEQAKESIENMTVSAETLAEGSDATVTKTESDEVVNLHFGLPRGATGGKGDKGDTGNGIASVVKTGTEGLVDTYTITFTDGTTTTFMVTNGQDGEVTQAQLDAALGGEKALTPISTNSIIGTDGTQKSPQAGTLVFYQFSDVSIYDSVTFTFPTTTNGTSVHWFNQIDADGNVLSHAPLNTPIGENKTNTVTLLDGCKTVKISVWTANGAWSNVFFATSEFISKGGIYAKVSALGDSITYGYSSDGMVNKTYLKQIADNFVSEYQNLGVVSTPICPNSNYTGTENQNAFVYRYSQIASDADLIIVAGGTNDFGHRVPIGTPTDGNDKFEETFYGALNYLITNIVTEHPHARLVFITPFHRDGDDVANSTGAKLIDYVNAIKDKCSTFGIACVDGYSLSGINTITAFRSANLTDGLHPNQTGHNLIYKNLMPYFAMF